MPPSPDRRGPGLRLLGSVLAGLALVAGACGAGSAGAGDVRIEAAPLLAAHAGLEELAALVVEDPQAAVARWPALDADVQAAISDVDPRGSGLATEDRSLLVGYVGGLGLAREAWADVVGALQRGVDAAEAERRARTRMAQLERLRAGVLVPPSAVREGGGG